MSEIAIAKPVPVARESAREVRGTVGRVSDQLRLLDESRQSLVLMASELVADAALRSEAEWLIVGIKAKLVQIDGGEWEFAPVVYVGIREVVPRPTWTPYGYGPHSPHRAASTTAGASAWSPNWSTTTGYPAAAAGLRAPPAPPRGSWPPTWTPNTSPARSAARWWWPEASATNAS